MAYAGFYGYCQQEFQTIRSFSWKLKKRKRNLKDRQRLLGESSIDFPTSPIDSMYQFAIVLFEPKFRILPWNGWKQSVTNGIALLFFHSLWQV